MNKDRATVVAKALMQIIFASSIAHTERQLHIENILRDEFHEVKHQAVNERGGDV